MKTYIAYMEGDPQNHTKRDDLVKNIPLMAKNRHYDSVIVANEYNEYYDTVQGFADFHKPLLTVGQQYNVKIIPSVHNYLGPAWGQDVYTYPWMFPFFYGHEHTWDHYLSRVKLYLKYNKPFSSLQFKYFYMDFEEIFWAQQNSPAFTAKQAMRIAEQIMRFCEQCELLGVTPIMYDLDARAPNTGTPRFTMIESILVSCLTDSNIVFGDTNKYASPNGVHPDWYYTYAQMMKMYPDGAQGKVMAMGIENYNADYGWSFDDWDKDIIKDNVPWSALFGAVTPT